VRGRPRHPQPPQCLRQRRVKRAGRLDDFLGEEGGELRREAANFVKIAGQLEDKSEI
jgi:hypothetical protein